MCQPPNRPHAIFDRRQEHLRIDWMRQRNGLEKDPRHDQSWSNRRQIQEIGRLIQTDLGVSIPISLKFMKFNFHFRMKIEMKKTSAVRPEHLPIGFKMGMTAEPTYPHEGPKIRTKWCLFQ